MKTQKNCEDQNKFVMFGIKVNYITIYNTINPIITIKDLCLTLVLDDISILNRVMRHFKLQYLACL